MDGIVTAGAGAFGGDISIDLVIVWGVMEPGTAGPGWLYLMVIARGVVLGSGCPAELVRNCFVLGPVMGCGWNGGICLVVAPVMGWGWNCVGPGVDWGAGWLYFMVTGWYWVRVGFCTCT